MNRQLRGVLLFIGIVMVSSSVLVIDAKAQGVLGAILNRMSQHSRELTTLRSDLTMLKFSSQLNVTDTANGSLMYFPKNACRSKTYIRVNWTKPVDEQLLLIEDDYELYRPRLNQVIFGSLNAGRPDAEINQLTGFININSDKLRANYNVTYTGEEKIAGSIATWHLQLVPRSTNKIYKLAEIWVDRDGMPRQTKVTDEYRDTTTVLLSNIEKNFLLEDLIIKIPYPKNAKRIKS